MNADADLPLMITNQSERNCLHAKAFSALCSLDRKSFMYDISGYICNELPKCCVDELKGFRPTVMESLSKRKLNKGKKLLKSYQKLLAKTSMQLISVQSPHNSLKHILSSSIKRYFNTSMELS